MAKLIIQNRFPTPVDRAAVGRDWRARGYSCDLFVDPPGREWRDFVHGTNELVTVVEGKLEMIIEGAAMVAAEGDEIFIPRGAVHTVRNIHAGTTRWLFGYD